MAKVYSREEGLLKMADLCARSEQCEFDIARKLRAHGVSSSDIASIIAELRERKFIDDFRFARSYARDKVRFSSWGRMKIRASLRALRIPERTVSEAILEIDDADYEEALMRCARSKGAQLDLGEYDDRARLYRHLLSRGFESTLSSRAVSTLRREQSASEDED